MARKGRFAVVPHVGAEGNACQRGQRRGPGARHDRGAVVFHLPSADAKVNCHVLAGVPGQHMTKHLMQPSGQTRGKFAIAPCPLDIILRATLIPVVVARDARVASHLTADLQKSTVPQLMALARHTLWPALKSAGMPAD
jgi:hypothetical protein